jgi:hypothetical protein
VIQEMTQKNKDNNNGNERTFAYAEIKYFSMWWKKQNDEIKE